MSRAIEIHSLSKRYRLGLTHAGSVRELANRLAHRLVNGNMVAPGSSTIGHSRKEDPDRVENGDFWALRDVSFCVDEGEVVGIIGANGAGKSTLLKLLSRVTYPTRGRIELFGRVASLLEVGTGFHPELTGRENVFLNGAILGMSRREIRRQLDAIVDFAGVERFLDTPVKRYSSGMTVRLGFAVAAHLDSEILIVDEVLAVGDIEFQNRCIRKMQNVADSGKTVLFVSHNLASIRSLTTRTVVLSDGRMIFDGPTGDGIARYVKESLIENADPTTVATAKRTMPGLDQKLRIVELHLMNLNDDGSLDGEGRFLLKLAVEAQCPCGDFRIAMAIFADGRNLIGKTFSEPLPAPIEGQRSEYHVAGDFPLAPGRYHCGVSIFSARSAGNERHDALTDALPFKVSEGGIINRRRGRPWTGSTGYIHLNPLRTVNDAPQTQRAKR